MKGLVFGAFGEASEDIHSLVQALAEARLKAVRLRRGRDGSGGELLPMVVSMINCPCHIIEDNLF